MPYATGPSIQATIRAHWRVILLVGAGSALAGALVEAVGFRAGVFSETMAAWIQAIGSVLAIIAAVWLQDRQRRLDRLQELAEFLSALKGAAGMARWLSECALKIDRGKLTDDERRQYEAPLGGPIVPAAAQALDQFDTGRLPTAQLVEALVSARVHMQILAAYCDGKVKRYEVSFGSITHYLYALEDLLTLALTKLPAPVIPDAESKFRRLTTPEEREVGAMVGG
jgi:hypothetical protein